MQNENDPIVQEAWPAGLLSVPDNENNSGDPVPGSESCKCAPENWIVRRPISHFKGPGGKIMARHPPRNLLNAKFRRSPRSADNFEVTATYPEPPFPLIEKTCAFGALCELRDSHTPLTESVHVLHLLRCIYRHMGDPEDVHDEWLQRRVTVPSRSSIDNYRNELQTFNQREKGSPSARLVFARLSRTTRESWKRPLGFRQSKELGEAI